MPVLHLSAAGVPIGWTITALYHSSYGIALNSARSWHELHDGPEAVIEIENGKVKRSGFYWKPEYAQKQYPDRAIHLQSPGYSIDEAVIQLAIEHMTQLLRETNFLIPREEWERRYPASKLISDRFSEWDAACDAAGSDKVEWEPRWAMFMEAPESWQAEFKLTEDGLGVVPSDPAADDVTGGYRWADQEGASNARRAMNSGFSFEQALILQATEPVDQPAPTLAKGGP